jgi:hypothetical protein
VEVPQPEIFHPEKEPEQESEINEKCMLMLGRLQKELVKNQAIEFDKLTVGQDKAAK